MKLSPTICSALLVIAGTPLLAHHSTAFADTLRLNSGVDRATLPSAIKPQSSDADSPDTQAIATVSAILASQAFTGPRQATTAYTNPAAIANPASTDEPDISAALPTHTTATSALTASASQNASSVASALAITVPAETLSVHSTATAVAQTQLLEHQALTGTATHGNHLTINIELPGQFATRFNGDNALQNITINLSFPPDDTTPTAAD